MSCPQKDITPMSFIMSEEDKALMTADDKKRYLETLLRVCAICASDYDNECNRSGNKCNRSLIVNPIQQLPEPIPEKASWIGKYKTLVDTIIFIRQELSEKGHPISEQPVLIKYEEEEEEEGMLRLLTQHTRLVAKTINWSQYTEELSKKVLSFELLEEILFELLDMV